MEEELVESIKEETHNRNSLCRLCACYTQLLIPIFEGEGLENNLSDKIEKYLPIQVVPSDVLPVQICFQCASSVISWHELSESCVQAEQKLKAMFITTNNNPQCSPSGQRDPDESASFCEPFTAVNSLSPSNAEMLSSDNRSESQKTIEEIGDALSKGGETERCLQEVKLEEISQKLICQFCNIEFSDTSSLGKHLCLHNPMQYPDVDGVILHMCFLCPESFGTEHDRMTHLLLKHSVENIGLKETNQNCQYCGRYFRHSSVLNMHIVSCRKLIEKFDDNDGFCDYVTLDRSLEPFDQDKRRGNFRKNLAKRGSRSSYSTVGRTELQSKASKTTTDYNKSHIDAEDQTNWKRGRQVKDTKETRVSCAYCMKSFTRKYDAISHVRKSHRSKLEEFLIWLERRKLYLKDKLCSFCDKTFESSEEATKHIQDCHRKSNENSLVCELCLLSWSSEAELLKHIADHSASDDGNQVPLHIAPAQDLPTSLPVVQLSIDGNESGITDCADSSMSFFLANGSQNVGEVNSPTVSMSSQVSITNKTEKEVVSVPVNCESLERTDSYFSTSLPEPTNISFNDPTGVVIVNERLNGTNFLMNSLMSEEDGIKFTAPGILSTKGIGAVNSSIPLIIDPPLKSCLTVKDSPPLSNCSTVPVDVSKGRVVGPVEAVKANSFPLYRCLVCNWLSISKQALIYHSDRHSSTFKNFCYLCWKYFPTSFRVLQHVKGDHKRSSYSCNKCKAVFLKNSSKLKHNLRCFKKFPCHICNLTWDLRKNAAAHKLAHAFGGILKA